GTVVRSGTRFARGERGAGGGWRLRLHANDARAQIVDARFVVDATGMRAGFARATGAHRLFLDRVLCVTAFFELGASAGLSTLTMLEAVEYGWWYAARLPNRRVAVAVASDADVIKQRALRRPEDWLAHLRQTRHIAPELAGGRPLDDSHVTSAAASFVLD